MNPFGLDSVHIVISTELVSKVCSERALMLCRYLAESKCAGMCVNLCKAPVQTFFTEELGMPLTMKPNFEDFSCEMVFGLKPPPLEEDEVMQAPCIAECTTGVFDRPTCHKLL